jgi:hypothetical protein
MTTTLTSVCARPACRAPFDVSMGRGRPKLHCSEECRRLADTEYKQAVSVVRHYEGLVLMARIDLARFGRDHDDTAALLAREQQADGGAA